MGPDKNDPTHISKGEDKGEHFYKRERRMTSSEKTRDKESPAI